ncbi:aminotransferase class I/II-fold pyridoxal phosphate-dependent enzyme [Alteromonas sp. MMG017]|uniref:aminotransferase class I/II-fold pyridoxal phosphate-dependent enzyme n=1 Tax=Alteromonas sp. MMG017 TaxID=2822692 RepID=UPI001B39F6B6|nr:aminotransferase class I/II-fold pyridoxal phosphate-dependent enzyme [Alteromonas sp. MMG017]MBQ4831102.1 aminotransferase class I/II-fold pyridoxal phosphate-dependent enzyme [Alteromonas sp. MMG017]
MKARKEGALADAEQIKGNGLNTNAALKQQVDDIDNLFSEEFNEFSTLWHTPLCHGDIEDKHDDNDNRNVNGDYGDVQVSNNRLKFSSLSSRFPHAPENAVSMWIADMDTAPSKHIAHAISAYVSSHYGYQSVDIGEVVAARYAKQGAVITANSVVSTASVMAAVDTALKVCTTKGDKVMVLSPTYGPLRERIAAQGLALVDVSIDDISISDSNANELGDEGRSDAGDEKGLEKNITALLDEDCSAFVLCHPNNPTGTVLSESLQHEIARFCKTHNITLILDEVHSEFGFVNTDTMANTTVNSAANTKSNTKHITHYGNNTSAIKPFAIDSQFAQDTIIRINSAGKAFNLSAIPAASYAIIANDELRDKFAREIDSCHLEASPVAKVALIAAYEKADDWLACVLKAIAFNRQYTKALMNILSPTIPFTLGEAGYFLWLNLNQRFVNDTFVEVCKRGVIGVDGASFNAPGYLRLNLACHPSAIKTALLRLFS